jgi:DNA gyrase subunit A
MDVAKEIHPINIEDELKNAYLDYAMSVIVGRALPDVRDGLKPVHRRVLFAMYELGNDWNKSYKKSARVVGDVIGKYHPHGDTAVYDTIVRMAQPFSLRYMFVDGQGNFGSIDGDNAAAMRYTEVRMSKIAHELLADLDKETVDFVPNYDGSEFMPAVLPTKVPALLINGSSGIAVGMATNIPPHNLTEVIDGCLAYIDRPEITIAELMNYIKGPDFPTAGQINGVGGIINAYRTGRGSICIRARAHVEHDEKSNKATVIVTELPYQVNKARLIEKIAELVKEKKIEGISELRDESDKDGMRIVIELRRGESGEVVLNNLYAQTQMETNFGVNMVALVDQQPKTLNLKQVIELFIRHRREVVTRRTVFLLRKARERGHILEGLSIAIANIDEVIALIKSSKDTADARYKLITASWVPGVVLDMLAGTENPEICRPDTLAPEYGLREGRYYLSPEQAQAILDLRLQKLTGLEHDKLLAEYREKIEQIRDYLEILHSQARLYQIIRDELKEVRDLYGDARRTEIIFSRQDLRDEDLIPEETVVLTVSHGGYAKTQPMDVYRAQKRGGKGKVATQVKDEDYVDHLLVVSTHDTILCFTNLGKVYWLRVFHIPQAGRNAKGKPIVNLLPLVEGERITAILPYRLDGKHIFMATSLGVVKKVDLTLFEKPRSAGLIALDLDEGDTLVGVAITNGDQHVLLFSSEGKAIRFHEQDTRELGRTARGVRGIRLPDEGNFRVISLIVDDPDSTVLTVSKNGFGKRTKLEEFSVQHRAGQGVIAMKTSDRNGELVGAILVKESDEILLISDQGTLVRTRVSEISIVGRNTQGVGLIKLNDNESLVGVSRIEEIAGASEDASDDGTDNMNGHVDGVEDSSDESSL